MTDIKNQEKKNEDFHPRYKMLKDEGVFDAVYHGLPPEELEEVELYVNRYIGDFTKFMELVETHIKNPEIRKQFEDRYNAKTQKS